MSQNGAWIDAEIASKSPVTSSDEPATATGPEVQRAPSDRAGTRPAATWTHPRLDVAPLIAALFLAACTPETAPAADDKRTASDDHGLTPRDYIPAVNAAALRELPPDMEAEIISADASRTPRGWVIVCGKLSTADGELPYHSVFRPGQAPSDVRVMIAVIGDLKPADHPELSGFSRFTRRACSDAGLGHVLE